MPYHFSYQKYIQSYNNVKSLQFAVVSDMEYIIKSMKSRFPDIRICWTRKNGLGCVFTDVEESELGSPDYIDLYKNGFLIGRGEAAIFQEIKNTWDYVFFTKDRTHWADPNIVVADKKILLINIHRFREIMKGSSSLQSVVKIFLKPEPPEDLETILKKLLNQTRDEDVKTIMERLELLFYRFKIQGHEDLQLIIRIVSSLLDNLEVENPEILKKIPDLANISELIVKSHSDYFSKRLKEFELRLKEFETMVDNNEKEKELQNFIKDNPWMLDFKFFNYPKPDDEVDVEIKDGKIGRIDLIFSKKQFGVEHTTIVEFKKADVRTTDQLRNMATIMSPVVKGLSQLINYIENKTSPYNIVEGILVIGKRDEETGYFIDTFEKYLHRMIKIVTYDTLLLNTTQILTALTQTENSDSTVENET